MTKGASGRLTPDHPLTDPDLDQFGYKDFARTIAHSVLRGSPAEGLIVGIHGEWGLGKTTLLNFIEHFARNDPDAQSPIIVRFNPWWFSGRDDLLFRFFQELASCIPKNAGERVTKLATGLKEFGRSLARVAAPIVAAVPGVPPAVPGVVAGLAQINEAQPKALAEMKRELVEQMQDDVLRILVVIDDIDRLLPEEMLDIFRLVRAVADLPNVTYLLTLDRTVVTQALRAHYNDFGARYLDKIIQVSFDLPAPRPETINRFFLRGMDQIWRGAPAELLDGKRWRAIYDDGIASFLKTPRDVVRLLNALSFTFPGVRDEVNPIDFVGIEALRLFRPRVHRGIQQYADQFVGLGARFRAINDGSRGELLQFYDRWLVEGPSRPAMVEVLSALFPVFATVFNKPQSDRSGEAEQRIQRRVCAEECFDMYFRYSIVDSVLPRIEVDRILNLDETLQLAEFEKLAGLRGPEGPNRFRQVMEGVMDRVAAQRQGTRLVPSADALLRNCFKIGESVAEPGDDYMFSEGDDSVVMATVESLLLAMPVDRRSPAVIEGIAIAGVAFATRVVVRVAVEHGRLGGKEVAEDMRTLPDIAVIQNLEALGAQKIDDAAANGALWRSKRLREVLLAWCALRSVQHVRLAVAHQIQQDSGLMSFLNLLHMPTRSGGGARVDVSTLEKLLDVGAVVQRLEAQSTREEWSDAERETARQVLEVWAAKSKS